MFIIIYENQRGLLFRFGRFKEYLRPGFHFRFLIGLNVIIVDTNVELKVEGYPLNLFLRNDDLLREVSVVDVADETIALHYVDGKYFETLTSGKYAFFNIQNRHGFKSVNIASPVVSRDFPRYLFNMIPQELYTRIEVQDHERALLRYDDKYVATLEPGVHYFWNNAVKIAAEPIDARQKQLNLPGEAVITFDKVLMTVDFVTQYRITDYVKVSTDIDTYDAQIAALVEVVLKEYIGTKTFNEIVEDIKNTSRAILAKLNSIQDMYFVEFVTAGINNLTLPDDMRTLLNKIVDADREGTANIILKDKQIKATQNLLETAKLLDQNPTLKQLVNYEYTQKMLAEVRNLTVLSKGGTSDLLDMLASQPPPDDTSYQPASNPIRPMPMNSGIGSLLAGEAALLADDNKNDMRSNRKKKNNVENPIDDKNKIDNNIADKIKNENHEEAKKDDDNHSDCVIGNDLMKTDETRDENIDEKIVSTDDKNNDENITDDEITDIKNDASNDTCAIEKGVNNDTYIVNIFIKAGDCRKNDKNNDTCVVMENDDEKADDNMPNTEEADNTPSEEKPEPDIPSPCKGKPEPNVPAPSGEKPEPDIPSPCKEKPEPNVPAPSEEKPEPDIPSPSEERPEPNVPAPSEEKPEPDIPSPSEEKPEPNVPAPIINESQNTNNNDEMGGINGCMQKKGAGAMNENIPKKRQRGRIVF